MRPYCLDRMAFKHTPVPNGMLPFWRTDPHPLDNHRSGETLPEHSDIVIIGAGLTGSSVAYHILDQIKPEPRTKSPSVTILEARQASSGATGRNGKPSPFYLYLPFTVANLALRKGATLSLTYITR